MKKAELDLWRTEIQKYMEANPTVSAYQLEILLKVGRGSIAGFLNGTRTPYYKTASRIHEFVEKLQRGEFPVFDQEETFTLKELKQLIRLWAAAGEENMSESKIMDGLQYLVSLRKQR